MSWFSKLKKSLFPISSSEKEEEETKELSEVVDKDRKTIQSIVDASPSVATHSPSASTLSPFATRILEKAKADTLKNEEGEEEDVEKLTAPVQLFMTNTEAKMRVEEIKNKTLEKNRKQNSSFTGAATAMPDIKFNAFAQKAKSDDK